MVDDLKVWLENLGLGKYADAFADHDVGPDVLDLLTEIHLKELGVSLGDRLRLVRAISVEFGRATETPAPPTAIPSNTPPPTPSSDAERRPLTVMFCDLADSTALSTRLDPEDLQDVIRGYQETCTRLIQEYEGFVAKYMGDGILVYFGYPKSLEGNAERAVRSALDIVGAMAGLNRTLGRDKGVEIAVRIGIATGMVVVGEIVGEGLAQERTVIGEAPNMAARLQGLADRNGVVIGGLTKEIAGDDFTYKDMGANELKGITGLVQAWGVTGLRDDTGAEELNENDGGAVLPELVGRDEETGLLRRAWASVKEEGRGQVVTIIGEAGIGKSVLIDRLRAEVRAEGLAQMTLRCSPYHANSALYPVIEHFKRLAGWRSDDGTETRVGKLEAALGGLDQPLAETLPLIASLLSLPLPEDRYAPLNLTPQQQKQQTQDAIIAMMLEQAERLPLLALYEDLHWADPSTLELIGLLIEQAPTAALLMVLTGRPEFVPPWPARSHITPITLNRLERPHAAALVARIAGAKPLPEEVVDHIVTKTDGVPLYVEELTKTILASDILVNAGDRYELTGPLSSLAIPDTLQESLMARLDRLPQVRELAQLGSVLGREFAYEMICGLSTSGDTLLQEGLGQLVEAELLYQRGRPPRAKYIFKHALVQDAAYGSLLRRTREQYHRQAAELLENSFPDLVATNPEIVAHHYSEANMADRAAEYFQKAGHQALLGSANEEAISHLGKGLEIVRGMPDDPDWRRLELGMLIFITPALVAVRGYAAPEVEAAYRRALELSQGLDDTDKQISVLLGLSMFHFLRADIPIARNLAEQAVDLAKASGEPGFELAAARQLGLVMCFQGQLAEANACFSMITKSYDIAKHGTFAFRRGGSDFGVAALATSGFVLVALGFPDQAKARCTEAQTLARKISHPISEAYAHWVAAYVHRERREPEAALEHAAATMAIAEARGFPQYVAWITALRGGIYLDQGRVADAIADVRKGIEADHAIGTRLFIPNWAAVLADAHGQIGQADQGSAAIEEALVHIARSDERYVEAEVYRIKGKLLLTSDAPDAAGAEACLSQAIEIARSQKAKWWELRAATDLARLLRNQGKSIEARDLLTPVYDWFTEGFDTADLKDAKTLLDELT